MLIIWKWGRAMLCSKMEHVSISRHDHSEQFSKDLEWAKGHTDIIYACTHFVDRDGDAFSELWGHMSTQRRSLSNIASTLLCLPAHDFDRHKNINWHFWTGSAQKLQSFWCKARDFDRSLHWWLEPLWDVPDCRSPKILWSHHLHHYQTYPLQSCTYIQHNQKKMTFPLWERKDVATAGRLQF